MATKKTDKMNAYFTVHDDHDLKDDLQGAAFQHGRLCRQSFMKLILRAKLDLHKDFIGSIHQLHNNTFLHSSLTSAAAHHFVQPLQ